jgi:prepilin-type N-terminal cleavage/methylation domain-containing protein
MMIAPDSFPAQKPQTGFTLLEVAIVLMIVGLLLGGLLVPLSAQMEQRNINDTQKSLAEIKEALIGYALTYGRLPCPAAPTTTGVESPVGGGACTNFYNGFVPATTLGLGGTDSAGYAVDAWGNRIRYAVTSWNSASPAINDVFTTANGMSTVGIANLQPTSSAGLVVCSSATGISGSSCGSAYWLTSSTMGVPAVIFSTGKNGGQGSGGVDEAANLDANQTFVSHLPTASGFANGYFDDIVIWISPNVLVNRMVAAGKLP